MEVTMERLYGNDNFCKFTTPIEGLYMTGEDTMIGSISNAIMSGFLASLKVCNYIW